METKKQETKKPNTNRPWLKPNGRPLNDKLLKPVCRLWDISTWQAYLRWFEVKRNHELLEPEHFDARCGALTKSVFEEYLHESNPELQRYIGSLLTQLPKRMQAIIRRYYFEGRSGPRIARLSRISWQRFYFVKAQALSMLRAKMPLSAVAVFRLVRELDSQKQVEPLSIWNRECDANKPIREDRTYHPQWWRNERNSLKNPEIKNAVATLTDLQWQVAYRHFWCGQAVATIARDLRAPVNLISNISDVAVFKIKSHVAANAKPRQEYAS